MADLHTTPVEKLTFDDVVEFCGQRLPEDVRLEYKREFSSNKPSKQIAKEVVAFANTQGGYIIFGVEEEKETRQPKPDQNGIELGKDPRHTVLTTCAQAVWPPIPVEVSEFLRNPDDTDRGFLVVLVSASGDVPHEVTDRGGIYVRVGDHSEPVQATPEEVIRMADRRRHAMAAQDRRREFARDTLSRSSPSEDLRSPSEDQHPVIEWVSIGPLIDAAPLFTLSELSSGVDDFCVSRCNGSKFPFTLNPPPIGVLDGLYSVDFEEAALVDIYGNMTTRLDSDVVFLSEFSRRTPDSIRREDGKIPCVQTYSVFGQILATLHCAHKLYRLAGFNGLLKVMVRIDGVRTSRCVGAAPGGPL